MIGWLLVDLFEIIAVLRSNISCENVLKIRNLSILFNCWIVNYCLESVWNANFAMMTKVSLICFCHGNILFWISQSLFRPFMLDVDQRSALTFIRLSQLLIKICHRNIWQKEEQIYGSPGGFLKHKSRIGPSTRRSRLNNYPSFRQKLLSFRIPLFQTADILCFNQIYPSIFL